MDLKQPDADMQTQPAFLKPPCGFIVATRSAEGLCKLAVDEQGTIMRSACLGKNEDVSADMLTSLMNIPAALLHADLKHAVKNKEV